MQRLGEPGGAVSRRDRPADGGDDPRRERRRAAAPARLPMATTVEPTDTVAESPIGAEWTPGCGSIRSTAMSAEVSAPTICA